jgi:hypothetical protein
VRLFPDTDLMVFLCSLGRILFLSPLHLRGRHGVPASLQLEELFPGSLTETQEKYLQAYDQKFAQLNYQPTTTYRTTNYGRTLIRSYVNPLEPVRAVVMILEVAVNVNGVTSSAHSCTLEFMTHFTDGAALTTRNMQRKTLFDNPPFRVTEECPRVSDPGELRRRHLSKLAELKRSPLPAVCDFAGIVKEINDGHQRFLKYQEQTGAVRLNPSGDRYDLTSRVHWRGIRNHLNPFLHIQRFPRWRFLSAALLGIAAPVLTTMFVAPAAAQRAAEMGIPASLASGLSMLSAYAFAGIAIGYLLQSSNFLWTFIFTYLGVGAIVGFHIHPLPYSTFAAAIAHVAAQLAKRRRLILQPADPIMPMSSANKFALSETTIRNT